MNGYSILFTAVFLVVLATVAGVLGWSVIRGVSALAHHHPRRRGHRSV